MGIRRSFSRSRGLGIPAWPTNGASNEKSQSYKKQPMAIRIAPQMQRGIQTWDRRVLTTARLLFDYVLCYENAFSLSLNYGSQGQAYLWSAQARLRFAPGATERQRPVAVSKIAPQVSSYP